MPTYPTVYSYPSAVQQRVTALGVFTGALPAGEFTTSNHGSINKYTAGTVGGLFLWANLEPILVTQVFCDIGTTGDIDISLVNIDPATLTTTPAAVAGESILLERRTGIRSLNLNEALIKVVLLPYQALQIITSDNNTAQIIQVTAQIERTMVR